MPSKAGHFHGQCQKIPVKRTIQKEFSQKPITSISSRHFISVSKLKWSQFPSDFLEKIPDPRQKTTIERAGCDQTPHSCLISDGTGHNRQESVQSLRVYVSVASHVALRIFVQISCESLFKFLWVKWRLHSSFKVRFGRMLTPKHIHHEKCSNNVVERKKDMRNMQSLANWNVPKICEQEAPFYHQWF